MLVRALRGQLLGLCFGTWHSLLGAAELMVVAVQAGLGQRALGPQAE
jgi:hypothetical protein